MRSIEEIRADVETANKPLSARWAPGDARKVLQVEARLIGDIPDLLDKIVELEQTVEGAKIILFAMHGNKMPGPLEEM